MTAISLTEIHQRLKEEFPERYVIFNIKVPSRPTASPSMDIYDSEVGAFSCSNLEDGIKQLKLKLGLVQPEMRIEI